MLHMREGYVNEYGTDILHDCKSEQKGSCRWKLDFSIEIPSCLKLKEQKAEQKS